MKLSKNYRYYNFFLLLDIDECAADTDGCNQICTNTEGSFECSCRSGFTLLDDGKTCVEINECTLDTHNCQQQCINENGGFRCECFAGYSLNDDLRTCAGKFCRLCYCLCK